MATVSEPRGRFTPPSLALPQFESPELNEALRLLVAIVLALCLFGVVLLVAGRNPISAYRDILASTLGSGHGVAEVVVKMIPLMLCALAVAIPARVGLVNVGGEGQLYMGAWAATWAAITFTGLSRPLLLSIMVLLAVAGAAVWAAISAILRAAGWLNEVISTLLLNYVAILWVQYFVFGPWKDPHSANFPESAAFVPAAILPIFNEERVHFGLVFAAIGIVAFYFVLRRTRYGYEMRAIGGNPEAARRSGIPIRRYIVAALMIGGAFAGLAGLGETSAIQGRLRPDISPGYGYIGFLISWMAGHNPLRIVVMSFLFAVISAGGDSIQLDQHLPFATVNILMAITLAMVLAQRAQGGADMSVPFVQGVAAGAIITSATVFYGALGEVVVERAGLVNLGLEGTMITGACFGFIAAFESGNAYLGLLVAMLSGALFNMLFGWLVVTRRANQLASGLTLMFFAYGFTTLAGRDYVGRPGTGLDHWSIPGLSGIPWVGPVLFTGNLLTFLIVPSALLIWWLLYRTRWGLSLRTVGESRTAAFAAGLSPSRVQYQALFAGGMLGGLGGAYLSIGNTPVWVDTITNGVGFIAVALVIFASWSPVRAIVGALIFGISLALNTEMQARNGFSILALHVHSPSPFFLDMLPYLLTLAVLLIWGRKRQYQMPSGIMEVFEGTS